MINGTQTMMKVLKFKLMAINMILSEDPEACQYVLALIEKKIEELER